MTATEREYPFKFAERCLYEYPENCARLEALRERLRELDASSSVHAQSYEVTDHNGPGDPVAIRALRIETAEEEIARLEGRVTPISRMLEDLEAPYVLKGSPKAELALIMRLYYFGGNGQNLVAQKLGISRAQLYRKREEIVRLTLSYSGL